ncbi:hypothetical protein Tco_0790987 [Tanacetum coccineum]
MILFKHPLLPNHHPLDLRRNSQGGNRGRTLQLLKETQQDDSVLTPSNDPPLSGENSMQLSELMLLCTNLQKQVLDLEKAKDAQAKEIADLKKRRRSDNEEMFDLNDLHSDEVNVDMPVDEKQEHSAKKREVDTNFEDSVSPTTIEEITLAQTLIQIKVAKPKVVTTAATTTTNTRPKARGVVVHEAKSKKAESSEEKAKGSRNKILGKKRAGKEQQQESPKRQRMEDDKEIDEHEEVEADDEAKLKKHLVIVKDDDIAIDAIPLATKPPMIIEYKLLKEGIMVYYQLIRADGSSKRYSSMIRMLQDIDKEDLKTLWKLVKTKHGDIRPEDEHERVLWGDLKVMFEPDIKSDVWRNLQGDKVTIWKLYDSTHDNEAGSSRSKRPRQHETVEELLLPQVYHEFLLWEGCNRDAKSRIGCDEEIDDMLRIRVREAESDEEIFTSMAWIRAFNINEPIYAELCHEFYSTYEFDEVLGLYQAVELEEDGFNVYFEGGLRNDDNFNAQDCWLSISREDNLGLSRSHTSTIRNPILRVIHKMITYGLCQRTIEYDKIQKNDLWLLSMFDARHQNGVLTEDVVRSLSAPIYYRDLDTITLRDLIDSEGKLILEDPQSGVSRVGIPRPPGASIQDLYDRMGRMEIRQDAIERMKYRQSYHWDRYHGVFEHVAGVYSVPLQGAYNPPGYAQPHYDQYYQQYQPPPPQYQQQQDDDE